MVEKAAGIEMNEKSQQALPACRLFFDQLCIGLALNSYLTNQ